MFTRSHATCTLATAFLLGFATACGNAEAEPGEAESAEYGAPDSEASAASEATASVVVPSGTEIQLELATPLSTENSRTGDRFDATVLAPVMRDGNTAIPAGATVRGRVTAVQPPSDDRPAVLKLDFDQIEAFGETYPLDATLTRADIETGSDSSTGEDVAKVGVGAAAGAVLGRVIGGDATGTLVGAAVGAAAGTAIVLSNKDEVATMEEGSVMTIRLDDSLRIDLDR